MFFQKLFRKFIPAKDPTVIIKEYGIPESITVQVRRTPTGQFVIASPELPGLISQSDDLKHIVEMYNDAILTYFDVPKRESDYIFNALRLEGMDELRLNEDITLHYA